MGAGQLAAELLMELAVMADKLADVSDDALTMLAHDIVACSWLASPPSPAMGV
jgi:hypothetical protein